MVKSEIEDCSNGWSGEYESLPLSARLKLLRSRKQRSDSVYLKETLACGQCESVTRNSLEGEENGCFSSEEENMLSGQNHKEVFLDAKMLDSPCFQASDCSLNNLSSPSSSGLCAVTHGGGSYEGNGATSSLSSSEFVCNDRSPGSDFTVSTLQHSALSYIPSEAENEYDNAALAFSLKNSMTSSSVSTQGTKAKHEFSGDFDDALENVVLRERRKILLSRLLVKSQKPCIQACSVERPNLCSFSADAVQLSVLTVTEDSNREQFIAGNLHTGNINHDLFFALNTSKSDITGTSCAIKQSSALSTDNLHNARSVESLISTSDSKVNDTQEILKSKALPSNIRVKAEPFLSDDEFDDGGNDVTENSTGSVITLQRDLGVVDGAAEDDCGHLPLKDRAKLSPTRTCSFSVSRDLNYQNKSVASTVKLGIDRLDTVKLSISESNDPGPSSLTEPRPSDRQEKGLNNAKSVSSFPDAISVKIETFLSNEFDNEDKTYQGMTLSPNLQPVKTEGTISLEASDDELDHMSLLDRLMLLSKETSPSSKDFKNLRCPSRNTSSIRGFDRGVLESVESITVTRPRKRRRTATNSAETALEEDVPGLLKVLIGKGVSVEDIKLYGEAESDEAIDETFCEDSFTELEAVIGKVFSYREPLLKVTPICCSKGSNVTYCLGCLLSLVEQARFLRSQKWPVEWGWARDLQAFIFVFQRHNRIVLERPEYGYATYFFELLDSLSVGWQIRRLVIAMKLTGCGRISVLENRPLKVGEDLTEGEARVLTQYGWVPDTGLATMLNYCGRVVHDTNKERDGNEWRQKIGKMLVNGYNGGNLVPRFLLKKEKPVEKEWLQSSPEVKLEI